MFVRDVEERHFNILNDNKIWFTAFSPLAQGVLSNKYLNSIPDDSRVARGHYLTNDNIAPHIIDKVNRLNDIAIARGQSLAQMATSWLLANPAVSSVIICPRTVEQLKDSIDAVHNTEFSNEEIDLINTVLSL